MRTDGFVATMKVPGIDRTREVIASLTETAERLMAAHEEKRELWWPSDLLPPDDHDELAALRTRAQQLPDSLRVALAMNLLTEEGLPHFHRLIASYLGTYEFWRRWNNLWTAEEDRHGMLLRDYSRAAGIFRMPCLERRQFEYVRRGFDPWFETGPYHVLVYTTIQERATQIAYSKIAEAAHCEPTLRTLMLRISSEEARHYAFYRCIVADVIEADPEGAIEAAATVMGDFDMPGRKMPEFREMAEVVRRAGLYGPGDYLAILQDQIRFWRIAELRVSGEAARMQEQLLDLPRRLGRIAAFFNERSTARSFSFDFLEDHTFTV